MTVQVWQSNLTGEKIYTVCEIESPYYTYIGTEDWPDPPDPGTGGTTNYNQLQNRPQIGGITLSGNKELGQLGELQDFFDEKATQAVALASDVPKLTMTKDDDSIELAADSAKVKNGNDTVTATKDTVEVKNGSDVTTIKKNEIKTTDGTDTMTATPLKVEVKDADETTTVAKDSVEVKKGAVTTKIEDDRASMTDGTHTIAMSPVKATYGEHLKLDGDGVLESWEKVLGVGNFAVIEKATVSKAYAVGSYLLSGGTMYRVTKAISSGGTITTTGANANVEAKRVDEVIAELTAKDTAQDTEIAALANSGAKNVLDVSNATKATNIIDGLTSESKLNVKSADAAWTSTYIGKAELKAGQKYTISADNWKYGRIGACTSATVYPATDGSNAPNITLTSGATNPAFLINSSGHAHPETTSTTFTANANQTVYFWLCTDVNNDNKQAFTTGVLLRDAAITDDTYVPYAMSNAELTAKKQDVGDYVLNGGATGYADFKFSKSAHVQNMRRGNNQYSNGLSILGENSKADLDGVIREWLRYERHTGQLQGYIYKEGASSWEAVHSWQADEDTGWQTLTNAYVDIYYRKKNGIVFINMAQAAKQAITTEQITSVVQLPEGCRPNTTIYLYHEVAVGGSLRLQIGNTGYIALRATSSTIAQGSQIQGMNSFPV